MNCGMWILKNIALIGGAACVIKGLDSRLEVTHLNIASSKLPDEFDGFVIVHISDYHCDTVPGLLEAIRCESPNVIFTTGDMADDEGSYIPSVRLFKHLVSIAPTFAVTGNHDLWRNDYDKYEGELNSLGVLNLRNETAYLKKNGIRIAVSGIDDPFTRNGASMRERVEHSLSQLKINPEMYNILLFHRANMLDFFKDKGFDLILSGHMHGGQFRLPISGKGMLAPKSGWGSNSPMLFPKYFGGKYVHGDTTMIVNRGLGNPMIIPRLFNRPEVTVIKLTKER